jgi:hypothetical protein
VVIPETAWVVTEGLVLTWKDGVVTANMNSEFSRIEIHDSAEVGLVPADHRPPFLKIERGEANELSLQHFLDILGKPVSVFCSANPIAPCLEAVIRLPQEAQSGLAPSENGVVGFISKGSTRFLIMGQLTTPSIFRVTIISQNRAIQSLDIGRDGSLPYSEEVIAFSPKLFMISREYRSTSPDSFLVVGKTLELIDRWGNVYPFLFTPKNPSVTFQVLTVAYFKGGEKLSPVVLPIIMFSFLFLLLLLALFGMSKSKNILREPLDNSVQAIAIVNQG